MLPPATHNGRLVPTLQNMLICCLQKEDEGCEGALAAAETHLGWRMFSMNNVKTITAPLYFSIRSKSSASATLALRRR
jgi:hypothetical protein